MCTQIELILGMCALQVAVYQSYKQYRVFLWVHPLIFILLVIWRLRCRYLSLIVSMMSRHR